jgi:hypothetical protein
VADDFVHVDQEITAFRTVFLRTFNLGRVGGKLSCGFLADGFLDGSFASHEQKIL